LMGLWAKASRARRTGHGILFVGPPQLPEAHFIGDLQHRVSPEKLLELSWQARYEPLSREEGRELWGEALEAYETLREALGGTGGPEA